MDLEPSAPLKVSAISRSLAKNKYAWMMYSPIEVCDGGRKVSVGICLNSGGGIEVLGDVYIATGRFGGGTLNIVSCKLPFDAESRGNASMSINGGY